jgi:hypothetical protein
MATDDENDGELNLPGLQIARDLYDIYFQALQKQTNIWSEAWKSIKTGDYQGKDLIRSIALAHERHHESLEELWRYPVTRSVQSNIPAWAVIDVVASQILGPIERRARTRTFPQEANLIATELAPFGANNISFSMQVIQDRHDTSNVSVLIDGWYEGSADSYYSLDDAGHRQRLASATRTGQYLGMVYDSRQGNEPPVLVVTLRISH